MAFRFTSPKLSEKDSCLKECPIGVILREAPYVYSAIQAHAYAECGSFNPLESPHWLQQAISVVGSEKERLRQIKDGERNLKRDSQIGQRMVRRGG
jgi:hypothetical protein